jgi:phage-related minor tail protein
MAELEVEAGFEGLTASIGYAQGVTEAFRDELARVQDGLRGTDREARSLSRSLGSSLRSAFEGLVFDGSRASDVLRDVGRSLASSVFSGALQPIQAAVGQGVQNLIGGGLSSLLGGLLPFAGGGIVGSGRLRAFAGGGVVDGPTLFPMRGGLGLMGEAGPEAIMPLARGSDGRLGIRGAGGGAPVYISMQVTTPDADGFRRSQSQIAANLARALRRGQRNL